MGKKIIAEGEWVFERDGAKQRIQIDVHQEVVHLYWTVSPENLAQFEPNAGIISWSIEEYLFSSDTRLGFLDKPVRKEVIKCLRTIIGPKAWMLLQKKHRK